MILTSWREVTSWARGACRRCNLTLLALVLASCRGSIAGPAAAGNHVVATAAARVLPRCHEKRIAPVRAALSAILTGEQVYFQRNGGESYIAVSDTAELRRVLGIEVQELDNRRWSFSVSDVSGTGFTAWARGRPHTATAGLAVILAYDRTRSPAWSISVEGCRPTRSMSGGL
jgi:hypothetical protein